MYYFCNYSRPYHTLVISSCLVIVSNCRPDVVKTTEKIGYDILILCFPPLGIQAL